MLKDYSNEDLLSRLRKAKELEKVIKEYELKLKLVLDKIEYQTKNKREAEETRTTELVLKDNANIINKLLGFFRMGKYSKATKKIALVEETIREAEIELEKLVSEEEKLISVIEKLIEEKKSLKVPAYIKEDNGEIVITEDQSLEEISETEELDDEKKVLIHCTDFFPKDNTILSNFDGGKVAKVELEYNGVRKEVKTISHRTSVHFTINNRVEDTSDGLGRWDDPSYIIIDDYNAHESELENEGIADSWTRGSVQLSDKAIIMVKRQDKGKVPIPQEEFGKYNIIYYEGDPTQCLRKFLKLNGYPIAPIQKNDAGHYNSPRTSTERALDYRDCIINFACDNEHLSKEPPILFAENMAHVLDILSKRATECFRDLPEDIERKIKEKVPPDKIGTYLKIARFVRGAGLIKTDDGKYTFKSAEEIFDMQDDSSSLSNPEIMDLIHECFLMQQKVEENNKEVSTKEVEEMSLQELYKFKNQRQCEVFQKQLPEGVIISGGGESVKLVIAVRGLDKNLRENGEFRWLVRSDKVGFVEKDVDASVLTSDVEKVIGDFRDQMVELNRSKNASIDR